MTADDAIAKLATSFRKARVDDTSNDIPPLLYHYTSAAGLFGIIESGTLRGGNFSFMNDSSELDYGLEIVQQVLDEEYGAAPNALLKAFSKNLQHSLVSVTDDVEFFLTCFCAEGDLLSQWRGYGTEAGRFCLGFDARAILQIHGRHFAPVNYDYQSQCEIVRDAARSAARVLTQFDDDESVRHVGNLLIEKLIGDLCFFKHLTFAEEQEWRAVRRTQGASLLSFQPTGGLLRPFIVMFQGAADDRGIKQLPIRKIIVGSSPHAAQALKSVRMFVARHGYDPRIVEPSDVPLRGSM
jgi:DUF2971 family protein